MKYSFVAFFLILAIASKCQFLSAKDSAYVMLVTTELPNEYKTDTVAVKFLVSDSLGRTFVIEGFIERLITTEKAGQHRSGDMVWFNSQDKKYYKTQRLLDKDKKVLSKVTVWQTQSGSL